MACGPKQVCLLLAAKTTPHRAQEQSGVTWKHAPQSTGTVVRVTQEHAPQSNQGLPENTPHRAWEQSGVTW